MGRSFPTSTREKRSNKTHASKIDPNARLYKNADGEEGVLVFLGHVLMENCNGLVVDAEAAHVTGTAEREAAESMAGRVPEGASSALVRKPT